MADKQLKKASAANKATCSGGTAVGGTGQGCPPKVTVKITLWAGAVACPGHSHEIRAVGDPPGGTFSWSVSGGGATLVDIGGNPTNTGARIWLRCFQPNNNAGSIPEQKVQVSVTYTHPNGTAKDTKSVIIHGIRFVVRNLRVKDNFLVAELRENGLFLRTPSGLETIDTAPNVTIRHDGRCPRQADCARNHRVGWLQTIRTVRREGRWTNTLCTLNIPLPCRDAEWRDLNPPFYGDVHRFQGDGDTKKPSHKDGPGDANLYSDGRDGAPPQSALRKVSFRNSFTAWLAVQNIEWATHHLGQSFIFLRNFDWDFIFDVNVIWGQNPARLPVVTGISPRRTRPRVGRVQNGKGPRNPVLTGLRANAAAKQPNAVQCVAAPPLPP